MAKQTIFVSGLHSGPSPSAGLGVARSLRAAFGTCQLIGIDYWAGSSALHHEVFDDVWLKPSWDLIEDELYAQEIANELERGACWIPTLDLEVAWLARRLPPHRRLLAPAERALAQTGKPLPAIARELPFELPPALELSAPDPEIHAFCRAHSWRVWVKGPYHEAIPATSWAELERARSQLHERWRSDKLSIQAHVRGYEESVAFAAVSGALVDAVYMRKRIVTPDGKTWAGRIGEVPAEVLAPLEAAVRSVGWTGGAEVELLRDVDGRMWLMEWNPRFPAWVHGATLAGRNLPAALVRRALGTADAAPRALTDRVEFTRVVLELPVRTDLPLPLPVEPGHGLSGAYGKYGAALPAIVPMLAPPASLGPVWAAPPGPRSAPPVSPPELIAVLRDAAAPRTTPHRALLPRTAEAAFAGLARISGARLSAADRSRGVLVRRERDGTG
jgi:diaminopimelate decarboxylase